MKTKAFLFTLTLLIAAFNSFSQNTFVPDDNLEQALIDLGYDSGELNDSVPTENINHITSLTLSNKGIFDLTGIEDFSALKSLDCVFNQLTEINTLNNINLQRLNCSYNNIISIDLNSNYYLEEFYAISNQLTDLNLQNGNNNNLIINITNNPNLFCLQVDDPLTAYKNIYWHKDFQTGYTDDCSGISSYMTYVPDDNFEAALIDLGYDSGELNDSVPTLAIKYIKELNITYKGITDLTGIEDFTYLEKLYCANNEIAVIDLSQNTNLVTAFCPDNKIVNLDLSTNQKLTDLTLESNHLTSLNLQNGNNSNMTINVRGNPDLMCIEVDDPKTSYINTNWQKDLTAIYSIDCSVNPPEMTFVPDDNFEQALINLGYDSGVLNDSVPTMAIRNIEMFYISSNSISDLTGIENFVALRNLYCDRNQISELDLSKNVHLQRLICDYNNLIDLDLSNNYLLNSLHARNNQLTSLNLQNGNNENMNVDILSNPNLFCVQVDNPNETYSYDWSKSSQVSYSDNCSDFEVQMTYIPDDNFEQALIDLGYDYGELNDSVPTINIESITELDVKDKNISDLTGIEDFVNLKRLYCEQNNLVSLDLNNNTSLLILSCGDNQLERLNIENLTQLYYLHFSSNNIDSIYLSNNISLQALSCANNNLSSLNLTNNISLNSLTCVGNFLTKLELGNNSELTHLYCNENQLKLLDLRLNTKLLSINCSNNELTSLFVNNTNNNSFSFFNSQANPDLYCIQIDNTDSVSNYSNWDKDEQASYSENCSFIGAGIPLSEYNALVDFYNSTNGDNWTKSTNWLDTINHEVNDWYGITVENGHVTDIYFGPYEKYNLNGNIPNSIKDLTKLESLVIVTDNLNGELPEGLFELINLKTLYLTECKITGELSSSIGNLINLEILGLEANDLNGPIPNEIGNLSHLISLSLSENNFTGKIPSSIGNLTNLEYLGVSQNKLNGRIPSSIGNLSNLEWLLLDGNQIIGPLPVELANLKNIIKISIENNRIGFIDSTLKSAAITDKLSGNNRQIPEELATLIQMDTLYLGGNNFQFNDIEAIFYWDNYTDFNDFIYYPQENIGIQKETDKFTGENTTLSIDNYYPGPSDKYQWYKNNSAIPGKTTMKLDLTNIQLSDAGEYYCKVTNPVANKLTLTSQKITLNVTKSDESTGIPVSEYNALVDFYCATNGDYWTDNTNWLDTINHEVNDWYGITIENGHVTKIDLSNIGLYGNLPNIFSAFDSLKHLDVSSNRLYGEITLFSETKSGILEDTGRNLSHLNIANNNYVFSDLEPIANELFSIDTFIYAPQKLIGILPDTVIYEHDSIIIEIKGFTPGQNDWFNWIKDESTLSSKTESYLKIEDAAIGDSGNYYCLVENSLFPDLTLKSRTFLINVLSLVGEESLLTGNITIFPNPAQQQIFVNTRNKIVNLKIYNISGICVFEKEDFNSEWINIEPFSSGTYLFKISMEPLETINIKVIFK